MPKKIYRIVWVNNAFSQHNFDTLEEAEAFKREYAEGCPKNESMSDESREYWRQQSENIQIQILEEKLIGTIV